MSSPTESEDGILAILVEPVHLVAMAEHSWTAREAGVAAAAFVGGLVFPTTFNLLLVLLAPWAAGLAAQKDAIQAVQSLLTSAGVVAGAIWFLRRRRIYPRLEVTQQITHRRVADGRVWVRVTAVAVNKGDVLVRIRRAKTFLQQVVPPTGAIATQIREGKSPVLASSTEVEWECLAVSTAPIPEVDLEPEESDTISWDFILSEKPQTIIAYTHIPNETKRRAGTQGWTVRTVYDLKDTQAAIMTNTQPAGAPMGSNNRIITGIPGDQSGPGQAGSGDPGQRQQNERPTPKLISDIETGQQLEKTTPPLVSEEER